MKQSVIPLIQSCNGPVDVWKVLCSNFEKNSLMAKLMLRKRYHMMEMAEGSSADEFLREMSEITDRLSALGAPVSAEDQVLILLASLPASYRPLVTTLGAQKTRLDMITVKNAILEEEMHGAGHEGVTGRQTDQALLGQVGLRGSIHRAQQGRVPSGHRANRSAIKCYSCNQTDHFFKDCPTNSNQYPTHGNQSNSNHFHARNNFNRSNRGNARPTSQIRAKVAAEESDEDEYMLVIGYNEKNNEANEWIVDSGASCHMTFNREAFMKYQPLEKPKTVKVRDGRALKAEAEGTVKLKVYHDDSKTIMLLLNRVLHVPEMSCNLLSMRGITEKGFIMNFEKEGCSIISEKGVTVATG